MQSLSDNEAGLTYPALGIQKQSIEDVEHIFGTGVIRFMEKKGYDIEAQYVCMCCIQLEKGN